ncbi:cupin domain-containing protein [Solibaculum mannosilyticum]|uniref:Cupin type-2 domain-containing protein n=1 Tax=Solibaculum mannosilyticum TaxID=2780922 RepID=A0A7I8CYH2_9FIRM|nr:cupin domain-containing protein [Solibaculum mannosilyticum]BCI59530.1 hypothetical protein C12CBH8_01690 [Solibaculum mannosilyticum]
MDGFMTPPNHLDFKAKKLFDGMGSILDGSIAYVGINGGGPTTPHTHVHSHLFIVTKGQAKIVMDGREVIVKENESYFVDGKIPHSVWNNAATETVMIGISVSAK